jgi:hypothetical protein
MGSRKLKIKIPIQSGKSKYKTLKPYVDYYPTPINKGKKYKAVKDDKSLEELFYEDRILKDWGDIAEIAKVLYLGYNTTQKEALQQCLKVLIKGANLFRSTDHKTFLMCDLLYTEINKKVNKGKSFSRIVKDNLLQVASFMDTHPDNINPSMTEIKKLGVKRWSNSNQNIDTFIRAVQLRYNRLVRDKRKEFLEMRSNKAARIFTYAADNS